MNMKSYANYSEKLNDLYDVKIDSVISIINREHYDNVMLQLPDGLKPIAKQLTDKIERKTKASVFIWLGSCFGFCDLPIRQAEQFFNELEKLENGGSRIRKKFAIIHFGHSVWPFGSVYDGMNIIEV